MKLVHSHILALHFVHSVVAEAEEEAAAPAEEGPRGLRGAVG